jgi:hypothetical protein
VYLRPAAARLDSIAIPAAPRSQAPRSGISTKAVRQLSSGSLAGSYTFFVEEIKLVALDAREGISCWIITNLIYHLPSGFGTGLVVAIFSRTLVFLGSFLAVSIYVSLHYSNLSINNGIQCSELSKVASRYGVDLPKMMGIKKLLNESSFWRRMSVNPWFSASFILTFTLAAFVRL